MMEQMIISEDELPKAYEIVPFRYLGSKYRFLSHIYYSIKEFEDARIFFDAMAGSAVVSVALKRRFNIISSDVMKFSYIIQKALVEQNYVPKFNFDPFPILNNLEGYEGFVYKHYRDIFFSAENAAKIDAIRKAIEDWKINNLISQEGYYYLLACLLYAVQKVSATHGSYIRWHTAYIYNGRAKNTIKIVPLPVVASNKKHICFNADVRYLAKKVTCDILYLDPPTSSLPYQVLYHVLETIAIYDNPPVSGRYGLRKDWKDRVRGFTVNDIAESIDEAIMKIRAKYVVITYPNIGIISKEQIQEIMSKYAAGEIKIYNVRSASKRPEELFIFTMRKRPI